MEPWHVIVLALLVVIAVPVGIVAVVMAFRRK